MKIDYTTFEQQVAEWREGFIQNILEGFGEEQAKATAEQLSAKPWLALQWFVEDTMPRDQRAA